MKAFLMYRDRDFDPQQILSVDSMDHRANRDDVEMRFRSLLPWNEEALTQDLGLEILFNAMSLGDTFLYAVARVAITNSVTDPDTIIYRQRVFQDCVKYESVVMEMYQIAIEAIQGERKNYWSSFGRYPSGTLHRGLEILRLFVGILKRLRTIADNNAERFESEGFTTLLAMLRRELSDDYFAKIEDHLERLQFDEGVLISAALGRGNKGYNYLLRKQAEDKRIWIARRLFSRKLPGFTFQLHPRDESGARALSVLRDQGVNLVANALAQSTDHILSFFHMLRTELAFYVACLNLQRQLTALGEPTCLPNPTPIGERNLVFHELYDVCLALSAKQKVIGNDLSADGEDIIVITGANTGGKSTFMRSVGLARLMMQAGMFVPAESFTANICQGLFTHFKREEDVTMESGKLDEELARMSSIIDHLTENSLVLFNESFAATNEREGSEIATQIVRALLEKGIEVIFVTHLYKFARGLLDNKIGRAVFLRAERKNDGTRTFKITEGEPLQTSYGKDLYDAIFREGERKVQSRQCSAVAD